MAVNLVQTVGPIIAASATMGGLSFKWENNLEKIRFCRIESGGTRKKVI